MRERLDRVLVTRHFVGNLDAARQAIADHLVLVNGAIATSQGHLVATSDEIRLTVAQRYVSRGGQKFEAALTHFGIDISGKRVLDAGASTGGFTDCALQHGAREVVALDVGRGLLHDRIARDPRVIVMDETNVRDINQLVSAGDPKLGAPFDVVVADLSFISLRDVLGSLVGVLRNDGDLVLLIKPQFEATRGEADKGSGVITDQMIHDRVCREIVELTTQLGCLVRGVVESPLVGQHGNIEFLLAAKCCHH